MPAPQQSDHRAPRQARAHRLLSFAAEHLWNEQDPHSLGTACVMTGMGVVLLVGFVIAVLNDAEGYAGLLLLFGCALMLFGSLVLLFALLEWTVKWFSHPRKYCGCCTFYKPQEDEYALGMCRADPREGRVRRTHYCPSFRYSERAMVRDRLWQQRYLFERIRSIQVDSEQADSDD